MKRNALIHLTAQNVLSGPATTTDMVNLLGVSPDSAKDRGDVVSLLRHLEHKGCVVSGRCETRGQYTWTASIKGAKIAMRAMGLL